MKTPAIKDLLSIYYTSSMLEQTARGNVCVCVCVCMWSCAVVFMPQIRNLTEVSVDKDASVSSSAPWVIRLNWSRGRIKMYYSYVFSVSVFAGSWMGITSHASPRATSLDSSTSEFCKYLASCYCAMVGCLYVYPAVHVCVRVYLFMPARAASNLAAHELHRPAAQTGTNPAEWRCFRQVCYSGVH